MGVICTCNRCGKTWQGMAGAPTFTERYLIARQGNDVHLITGETVCNECADADGGFCSTCMLKPCRNGPHCPKRV